MKHMVICGAGCDPGAPAEEEEKARKLLIDMPRDILGAGEKTHVSPNLLEDYHDATDVRD